MGRIDVFSQVVAAQPARQTCESGGGTYLYIGKAVNGVHYRYIPRILDENKIKAIQGLTEIPNNGVALGVEQAIMELNGWAGKTSNSLLPILSNKISATTNEILKTEGIKYLNSNVPNWQTLFKF
ncbi:MAG: hypothetical protein ACO1PI_00620 [Bacteroidota bacterium]